jgi:hypothetical protein
MMKGTLGTPTLAWSRRITATWQRASSPMLAGAPRYRVKDDKRVAPLR